MYAPGQHLISIVAQVCATRGRTAAATSPPARALSQSVSGCACAAPSPASSSCTYEKHVSDTFSALRPHEPMWWAGVLIVPRAAAVGFFLRDLPLRGASLLDNSMKDLSHALPDASTF